MSKLLNTQVPSRKSATSQGAIIAQVHDLHNKGMSKKAISLTKKYARKYDTSPKMLVALAALSITYEHKGYARSLLNKALSYEPNNVRGLYNYGLLYLKEGNFDQAESFFEKAFKLDNSYTSAIQNLLYVLVQKSDVNSIRKWYGKLLVEDSLHETILLLFVKSFKVLKADADFAKAAEDLHNLRPNSFESNFNFALAMQRSGHIEVAKKHYKEALLLKPNDSDALNNLAKLFFDDGDIDSAIGLLDKTDLGAAHKPAILHNMGVALYAAGKLERSKEYLTQAAELQPTMGDPHYTLGLIAKDTNEYNNAHEHFGKAIQLCNPETSMYTDSIAQKWLLARYSMDWQLSELEQKNIAELGILSSHIAPFTALPMEDNPMNQLLRSRKFSNQTYPAKQPIKDFAHYRKAEKINIAYISADFHQFPGMTLMSGMFAAHDRSKFKVFALSYGPERVDPMRKKIMRDVDKFIDVKDFTDEEIVSLCSNLNIHIAVHRNGYTKLHRTSIFAKRVAPIQISFLGYPSTMGADFMDYLVADEQVITSETRKYYSEAVIYMPSCYQPNDRNRSWPSQNCKREGHGLKENAVVLCCFNNPYKISRTEFDLWCTLLKNNDHTQLWLLDPGGRGRQNLRNAMREHNLHDTRLVFAPKVNHFEHLARHSCADLFVDTFNYNAHTTATDALGMGVPVITLAGKQFSARVASSILMSLGLNELVAHNEAEYFSIVQGLLNDRDKLALLKKQCLALRDTHELFDINKYTRDFESLLLKSFDRFKHRQKPADISLY